MRDLRDAGQELLFESLYRNGGRRLSCRQALSQAGCGHTSVCLRPLLLILGLCDGLPSSRYGPGVAPSEPICNLRRHGAREDQRPRESALAAIAHRLATLSSRQPCELSEINAHGDPRDDHLSGNTPASGIRLQDPLPARHGQSLFSHLDSLASRSRAVLSVSSLYALYRGD
jgi:hypothetical protein